jgi:hypothetical protein
MAADRFVVRTWSPDRSFDAELEQNVLRRIVLPHARGRDQGWIV